MAFKGLEPVRSKIIINNQQIEKVNIFKFLACILSFNEEQ